MNQIQKLKYWTRRKHIYSNFNKTKEQLKREFLNFENEHWELYSISRKLIGAI